MLKRILTGWLLLVAVAGWAQAAPHTAELNAFIQRYVDATNSHEFANVAPLLTPDAVYWFNQRGTEGVKNIQAYFEDTWRTLPDEVYGIENVRWLAVDANSATCIYEYTFRGTHKGKPMAGRGRGTSVLVKRDGQWRIAHEHLALYPAAAS